MLLPYRGYAASQSLFGVLLAAAGAFLLPSAAGVVLVAMGGLFLLIGLLLWIIAATRCRLARRLTGDHLVRWTYGEAEWSAHILHERGRLRKLAWKGHAFFFLLSIAMGIAIQGAVEHVLAMYVVVLVLGQAYVAYTVRSVARHLDRLGETGECFIGDRGLYVTGQCHAWGDGFIKASLADDGSRLAFSFSTSPDSHAKVEIPVPQGQEAKARHVAKRWE